MAAMEFRRNNVSAVAFTVHTEYGVQHCVPSNMYVEIWVMVPAQPGWMDDQNRVPECPKKINQPQWCRAEPRRDETASGHRDACEIFISSPHHQRSANLLLHAVCCPNLRMLVEPVVCARSLHRRSVRMRETAWRVTR